MVFISSALSAESRIDRAKRSQPPGMTNEMLWSARGTNGCANMGAHRARTRAQMSLLLRVEIDIQSLVPAGKRWLYGFFHLTGRVFTNFLGEFFIVLVRQLEQRGQ